MEDSMEEFDDKESSDNKLPSCSSFLGHWRQCTSAKNHFHHYYIYGSFADCTWIKQLIKNCLYFQMTKDTEYKENFLKAVKELEDKENFVNKPSSAVWEFRENPAEDWLKRDE